MKISAFQKSSSRSLKRNIIANCTVKQGSLGTWVVEFLKGWGAIAKLLPLVDSFLLSTNKKAQFFTAPLIKTPLTPSPFINIISEALGVSRISDT